MVKRVTDLLHALHATLIFPVVTMALACKGPRAMYPDNMTKGGITMNLHSQQKTPQEMVEAIFALDLDPIKFKLMDKKEGQGWSREKADRLELEYRRFLALTAKYPQEVIAPSSDVDKFWHGHILDTMKYAEDCQRVFGFFLHHFPYFGMRDDEDAANLADAAASTRRLYEQEFGAAGQADAAYCARVAGTTVAEDDAAYCARVAGADAAYCARVAGNTTTDAAYCARVAGQTEVAKEPAYCARVAGDASIRASADAAYCARVAGQAHAVADDAAYCARVASSYCARVADKADSPGQAYCAATAASASMVLDKGRPTLSRSAA